MAAALTTLRSIRERRMQVYIFNSLAAIRMSPSRRKKAAMSCSGANTKPRLHTCRNDEVMVRLAQKANDDTVKAGTCLLMLHSSVVPMKSGEIHSCV